MNRRARGTCDTAARTSAGPPENSDSCPNGSYKKVSLPTLSGSGQKWSVPERLEGGSDGIMADLNTVSPTSAGRGAVLAGKRVLVTGGTGSLGQALVRRLLTGEMGTPEKVIVFSRDEAKQHEM